MKQALVKGYCIIRIPQEDVWNNTFDWQTALLTALSSMYTNSTPRILYSENPNSSMTLYEPYRRAMIA